LLQRMGGSFILNKRLNLLKWRISLDSLREYSHYVRYCTEPHRALTVYMKQIEEEERNMGLLVLLGIVLIVIVVVLIV